MLYDSNYLTFRKTQNYGYSKNISIFQGFGGERYMNSQNTENIQGQENTLCDTIIVDTCHYTLPTKKCKTLRVTCNVNFELWVIKIMNVDISVITNVSLGWRMWVVGEA